MADVPAKLIATLRKATGAGFMDCKQALEESDADLERAVDWLRVKGLGKAGKLSDRDATEGAVEALVEGNVGVVVELNCNTDFVAKGSDFADALGVVARLVAERGADDVNALPLDGSTVGDTLAQLAAKLGENVVLGRVERFESDGVIDAYKHVQTGRGVIGVLVELDGVDATDQRAREVAHEIALHVSFAAPGYLTRDQVPAEVVERERAVIEEKSRVEGVPEARLAGAVTGRLNAFYKDVVLLEQASVRDPKVTIGKLVEGLGAGVSLTRFARIKVGAD